MVVEETGYEDRAMSLQMLKGFIGGEGSVYKYPKNVEVEQDSSTAESVPKICGAKTAASEPSCQSSGIWVCSTEDQVRYACVAARHLTLGSAGRAAGVQLKTLLAWVSMALKRMCLCLLVRHRSLSAEGRQMRRAKIFRHPAPQDARLKSSFWLSCLTKAAVIQLERLVEQIFLAGGRHDIVTAFGRLSTLGSRLGCHSA